MLFLIKNRPLRLLISWGLSCGLLVASALYVLYGHQLVTAIYNGESLEILNQQVSDARDFYLLDYYLAKADRMALQGFLFYAMFLGVLFVKEEALAAIYAAVHDLAGFFHRRRTVVLAAVLVSVCAITSLIAYYVLQRFPNSADEYSYIYQARTFLAGRLWNLPHPLQQFFDSIWILHHGDKVFSMYWPGWPMVLTLAGLLHVPWYLVNPLLGVLSLAVFYKIGVRLYSEKIAFLATVLLSVTGFFLFNVASYFNHALCGLCILLYVHYCLRALDRESRVDAFLAGLFIGIAFITRPYSALVSALLPGLYLLLKTWRRPSIILAVIGGGLPSLLLLFAYNYQLTGDILVSPATLALGNDESWGVGLDNVLNLIRFSLFFLSWTPPFLLVVFFFLLPQVFRRSEGNVFALIFPLLVVAHFFFSLSGGNQYGPRYYFEGFPFLILFVSAHLFSEASYDRIPVGRRFLFALLAVSVVFSLPFTALHAVYQREVVSERMEPYRLVREMNVDNALVFLQSGSGVRLKPMPVEDLVRNDVEYKNRVLFVHDRGEENRILMRHYPERKYFAFRYSRQRDEYLLEPLTDPDLLR